MGISGKATDSPSSIPIKTSNRHQKTAMAYKLPPLPYAYDALEPFLDEQTMHIHHQNHHATYISKLNNAIKGTEFENIDIPR